ncbi:P-loop containing nucleoside triphosphate hydrolase protein [Mycena filopes]|nr:P-loop containing nucleoside triphosphate hydrolase protein [Mycena filopes]
MDTLKLVLVGDEHVGKTALIISYSEKKFPTGYIPSVADNSSSATSVTIGQKSYTLGIWDTVDTDEYDRLRPLSYPNSHVFLVCFSVALPASFEHIKEKWLPELHYFSPRTPVVIVAMQVDLRDSDKDSETLEQTEREQLITTAQGEALAQELGAAKYLECSAKTRLGVDDVFHEAAAIGVKFSGRRKKMRKGPCIVL